jgi:hypothetical protein
VLSLASNVETQQRFDRVACARALAHAQPAALQFRRRPPKLFFSEREFAKPISQMVAKTPQEIHLLSDAVALGSKERLLQPQPATLASSSSQAFGRSHSCASNACRAASSGPVTLNEQLQRNAA